MPLRRDLSICHTWDGEPLPEGEAASLVLHMSDEGLSLEIEAPFAGDPPPPSAPGETWKLWEHEVVELFVCGPKEQYTEIEVGPHGHFLVLRLEGVRNIVARVNALTLKNHRPRAGRWRASAFLPAEHLPAQPWRINAYRISGVAETRAYAAAFPSKGPAPDFHRLESFEAW